jgi:hypothetical protein
MKDLCQHVGKRSRLKIGGGTKKRGGGGGGGGARGRSRID